MIDWSKPIETVPCDRNPTPVKCRFLVGPSRVEILGDWYDYDGENEGNDHWRVDLTTGRLYALDGYVRNVCDSDVISAPKQSDAKDIITALLAYSDPRGLLGTVIREADERWIEEQG